jgi:CRP-like cAMP-binding protein
MTIDSKLYGYVAMETEYFDKAVIIKEGTKGNEVYLILEGRVKVKKKTPKGTLTMATLKEGDVFGELIFLQSNKLDFLQTNKLQRTASIVADGPVVVGNLDMSLLDKEYQSVSPLMKELISTLAKRTMEASSQLVSAYIK